MVGMLGSGVVVSMVWKTGIGTSTGTPAMVLERVAGKVTEVSLMSG